jgi:phosphoacetylglucosamine mutase
MYYYVDNADGATRLLDGDKIASLSAMFIMDLVKAAGVEIKVGVVQTAYANGNSTSYLTKVLVFPNRFLI